MMPGTSLTRFNSQKIMPVIPIPEMDDDETLEMTPPPTPVGDQIDIPVLPVINPSDKQWKITPSVLANILTNPLSHNFDNIIIFDSRFCYEFEGGHIQGAVNIKNLRQLCRVYDLNRNRNSCFIFHCELSEDRGPTLMSRFIEYDRYMNLNQYPKVSCPQRYLLVGGYRAFYEQYPELCRGGYIEMWNGDYLYKLKQCQTYFVQNIKNAMLPGRAQKLFRSRSESSQKLTQIGNGLYDLESKDFHSYGENY